MTAQQTTYDQTYLTDAAKIENLARWILGSHNPVAAQARRAMHNTCIHPSPSPTALRAVYRHLYSASDASVVAIIRAYTAPRPAPPRRR